MLLCLDVGNSHICGGIFTNNKLLLRFRHATYNGVTSDQAGIFLKNVLRENNIEPNAITQIAYCSVVHSLDYSLQAACKKYFHIKPFVIKYGIKTNFSYHTTNPAENGSDITSGIIAAIQKYPQQNLIIVDLGTITTFAAVTHKHEYLGATFIPGIQTAMRSFATQTAKLFPVEITKPPYALGRTTAECMQAGLFFGHLGAIKEIINNITQEIFPQQAPIIIATGGFAHLFRAENIFNHLEPDLVLEGIKIGHDLNNPKDTKGTA